MPDSRPLGQPETSAQWPDSHREIPQRYFPEHVGPGGFDIDMMRLVAQGANRGYIHELPGLKSWVVLFLLDRLQDAERAEAERDDLRAIGDTLQSSASRLAEFVSALDQAPYEVQMAAHEAQSAVDQWTQIRRKS